MRIFISIDMPEEIAKEIKKIQDKLPDFTGKKTEIENLHLTLKFLGEVDGQKVGVIKDRLREIKFKKFEAEVKYLGFFDNIKHGKRYGPVWLYLANCEGLQKQVDEKLKDLFPKERRFMSHLTITRVKDLKDKKEFLKKLSEIKIPEIKFIVKSFKLKSSVLFSMRRKTSLTSSEYKDSSRTLHKGPVYETIEEYNLDCKI